MKNKRRGFFIIILVETILIAFLFCKLRNTQKIQQIEEKLLTDMARSTILSQAAMMNLYNNKLQKGEVAFVQQLMRSEISSNVLFLQDKTYGELTPQENQSMEIILKSMASWPSNNNTVSK